MQGEGPGEDIVVVCHSSRVHHQEEQEEERLQQLTTISQCSNPSVSSVRTQYPPGCQYQPVPQPGYTYTKIHYQHQQHQEQEELASPGDYSSEGDLGVGTVRLPLSARVDDNYRFKYSLLDTFTAEDQPTTNSATITTTSFNTCSDNKEAINNNNYSSKQKGLPGVASMANTSKATRAHHSTTRPSPRAYSHQSSYAQSHRSFSSSSCGSTSIATVSTALSTAPSSTSQPPATPTPRPAYMGVPRWLLALPLLTLLVTVSGGRKAREVHPNPHQGSMQLTPWWNSSMAAGETLVLDCGVFVGGGDAPTPDIRWIGPSGNVLSATGNLRVELKLREKNHKSDAHRGAFRVLTLTIKNLEEADSGVYKCVVNRSTTAGGTLEEAPATDSRNLSLTVLQPDEICTIEGEDLCGWRDLADSAGNMIQWRRLDGSDEISLNRSSGRFDHTYGASKHVGHFLDVDRFREQPPEEAVARLQSPQRAPHARPGCFHFWYIYYGNDHEYLQVKVSPVNSSKDEDADIVFYLDNSNTSSVWIGDWALAKVNLPPQSHDYHVTLEVKTCRGRCKKSRFIALDDFRFFSESCEVVQKDLHSIWPKRDLPVRLVNGSTEYEGRVEVLHDAMWGSVCSTQFGAKEAKVICKYLGFKEEGAQGRRKSPDGGADDHVIIWLQRLGCNGTEDDLGSCIAKGETWGNTESCSHEEDARVLCGEVAPTLQPTLPVSMLPVKTTSSSTPPSTSTPIPTSQPHSTTHPVPMTTQQTHDVTTVPPPISTTIEVTDVPKVKTTPIVMTSSAVTGLMTSEQTPTTLASPTVEPSGGEDVNETTEVVVLLTTTVNQNVSNNTTDTSRTEAPVESKKSRRNTGAAVGIMFTILLLSAAAGVYMYRKRKNRRKSKYIVFSNPKYSREHLPANDISLDSPLTSGSSILA